jgi:starch phosphorylase
MFSFQHPYSISAEYSTRVAYFCMEYAIEQPLKLYAGGLGFLAGSHMRSAYALRQNMVGIGILWKYGYYDQGRKNDQTMEVEFQEKIYGFLVKTDIRFKIRVSKHDVSVVVWYLPPEVFNTAPVFFLSTDTEENDYLAKTISHKLYDSNPETKIAAAILLGVGGARLLEILDWQPEIYHLNESHALPLIFHLYNRYGNKEEIKKRLVYTNHTPESSGNEQINVYLLDKMDFFSGLRLEEIRKIAKLNGDMLDYTYTALSFSGLANGVSKMHYNTLIKTWGAKTDICRLIPITNAQDFNYWADEHLYQAVRSNDNAALRARKCQRKHRLFEEVADQNGELYNTDVLTIVFAKRFAGYKRPELLFQDMDRFHRLVTDKKMPVQIIWAGKPHPMDYTGIASFDKVVNICKQYPNCSILVGYELKLSRLLKQGADVWLNLPRITHEASGTSGMSAAMNGTINVSIPDGWFPEFVRHEVNGFAIPASDPAMPEHEQDMRDAASLYDLLEKIVIPMYYNEPGRWLTIIRNSMLNIIPDFDSARMAEEYYKKLYAPQKYQQKQQLAAEPSEKAF